jgi:hypothetical protein
VDIDQRAVEIEKNRLEFARRQQMFLEDPQPECVKMPGGLSSAHYRLG